MAKDPNSRSGINKPGLLTLTIKDKSALYLAYMPFVQNGGLFIPTNSNYRIGDEVFMLLNLMGDAQGRTGQAHRGNRRAVLRPGPRTNAHQDRELPGGRDLGR